jgi:pYEATS domain-containing protein involved in immunity/TIR domain-containing protein
MSLRIQQDESYVGDHWWKWSVWLDGPTDELARVRYVIYTLHPSFVPPVRTIKTRSNGFRLHSQGWGVFAMHLEIVFRDKTVSKRKYTLKLHYPTRIKAERVAEKSAPPIVYLSSTASDADTARVIKSSLVSRGIEVLGDDDLGAGMPLSLSVENMLAKSQHAIFVMSGRPSLWMSREIDAARRHGVPITPLLVGADSEVPGSLSDLMSMRISDETEIAKVLDGILSLSGRAAPLKPTPNRWAPESKSVSKREISKKK